MRDLLNDPLCNAAELGHPIPDSVHAVSVCLPTWADNIGYEEGEPRVIDRLATGYPRFVHHPLTRQLFSECVQRFAHPGETCIAFPSRQTAEFCREFMYRQGVTSGLHTYGENGIFVINFSAEGQRPAKYFWQHTGAIISSRLAEATLTGRPILQANGQKKLLRERIASLAGAEPEDVFLFPSGMAAIYETFRLLQLVLPSRRCVQFGFPYTDTIKIQEKFGAGVHFLARADEADYRKLEEILAQEEIMGLFCEFPSNPLLVTPDLRRLAELAQRHRFPLIVDDTIGSFHNVRVLPPADILVSSLTKLFSGAGDVMGGALILRRDSAWHQQFCTFLRGEYEDLLFDEDAIVLEENSRDYSERAERCGRTTELLCDELSRHPAIETVYYPRYQSEAAYVAHRRDGATFGNLFSLLLRDPRRTTAPFFDALRISKGPNLGTNFTLCCPYTILAHYQELPEVELHGVSRYLIRVSVGLEGAEELIARFRQALACCDV